MYGRFEVLNFVRQFVQPGTTHFRRSEEKIASGYFRIASLFLSTTIVLLLTCVFSHAASGQIIINKSKNEQEMNLPVAGVSVPMLFRGSQPVIEAFVNDQGPFLFAIDTAGSGAALLYKSFADRIELPDVGGSDATDGSRSRSVRFRLVRMESLRIDAAEFSKLTCAVRDTPADTTNDGRTLAGVLGIRCFNSSLLTLDFPNKKIKIEKGELSPTDGETILALDPTQPIPCLQAIKIGEHSLPARLDTGNLGTIRLPFVFKEKSNSG